MNELKVPLEAPEEVTKLLLLILQAATNGLIVSPDDAKSVWRLLVSVAALRCPENLLTANNGVSLEQHSDGAYLIVGDLVFRVTPNDNGVSLIANKPITAKEFDRPFGGFASGSEGVAISKQSWNTHQPTESR